MEDSALCSTSASCPCDTGESMGFVTQTSLRTDLHCPGIVSIKVSATGRNEVESSARCSVIYGRNELSRGHHTSRFSFPGWVCTESQWQNEQSIQAVVERARPQTGGRGAPCLRELEVFHPPDGARFRWDLEEGKIPCEN